MIEIFDRAKWLSAAFKCCNPLCCSPKLGEDGTHGDCRDSAGRLPPQGALWRIELQEAGRFGRMKHPKELISGKIFRVWWINNSFSHPKWIYLVEYIV